MRTIKKIYPAPPKHWVGNGFHVSPLFSHMGENKQTSPFLMFDYGAPEEFSPNSGPARGVGAHPHKGFETVTIAYHGEVAHRDSSGGGGVIKQGDVQWMTAGAGIIHDEFHSEAFSREGGVFEMAQIWVNLPKQDKAHPPRYQNIAANSIPVVDLPNGAGHIRVIAGQYQTTQGIAQTFTELNVWDVLVRAGQEAVLTIPANHNLAVVARRGPVELNGQTLEATQLAVFEREAGDIHIKAIQDAELVVLSGVPINEPIAADGPFVMNTEQEIRQAMMDYNQGKFGALA